MHPEIKCMGNNIHGCPGGDKEEAELADEPEKEEVTEDEADSGEKISVSKVEWDKMQAHAKTQAEFEQRRGTEIGELRAKNKALTDANLKMMPPDDEYSQVEKDRLEELAATDMLAWSKEKSRIDNEKKSARDSLINEQIEQQSVYEKTFLEETSPNWESEKDSVKDYLEGSGMLTPKGASDFADNPAQFAQGGMLFRIARDAASNESLKAENVSLKEKLKTMQSDIAANASKPRTMANVGTSVTDADGEDAVAIEAVEDMSDADLAALIKKG
jgi:hypothetical protein